MGWLDHIRKNIELFQQVNDPDPKREDGFSPIMILPSFIPVIDPPTITAPPLWRPIDKPEIKRIIPLQSLHKYLISPEIENGKGNPSIKNVVFNVVFYGNWFPKETSQQFELAHQELRKQKRQPSFMMMDLERTYAPNDGRFVEWMAGIMDEWHNKNFSLQGFSEHDLQFFAQATQAVQMWEKDLSVSSLEKIHSLFKPVYKLVNSKDFSWHLGVFPRFFLERGIALSAGIEEDIKRAAESMITEVFFLRPNGDILKELHEILREHEEKLDETKAEFVWRYLSEAAVSSCEDSNYWLSWEDFLAHNPRYVPIFLNLHDELLKKLPPNTHFDLFSVYSDLLGKDVVPPEYKRITILRIVEKYAGKPLYDDGRVIDFSEYGAIMDTSKLEELLMKDAIEIKMKFNVEGESSRAGLIEDIGEAFFIRKVKEWGAERTIEWLKSALPDFSANLSFSSDILRLTIDHSAETAKNLLSVINHPDKLCSSSADEDVLWETIWEVSGAPTFSSGGSFYRISREKKCTNALRELPSYLTYLGMDDLVRDFYLSNHPYASLYSLPPEIRPVGKGTAFITVDAFPDLSKIAHPEKSDVSIIDTAFSKWLDDDEPSHGFLTTSIATGKTLGLAPDARLYAMGFDDSDDTILLPTLLLEALKKARDARLNDPSISVIGFSLGLEVPQLFRPLIKHSKVYRELKKICDELHRLNVAIIVSAGNDGDKDNINMIGYLPHVRLVGAINSHMTAARSDDTVSEYTTGSDKKNPISVWAYADPIFGPEDHKKNKWYDEGGTSSAQPFVSAAILLMREVNPTLSVDKYFEILQATADTLLNNKEAKGIDPMEAVLQAANLPGSAYTGERLKMLTERLQK